MRAEAQAHADQINAALDLLRRFLDWDRALKRLGELNAKVEDQALWDNPKAAQDVIDRAVQLLGGKGVMRGAVVEHLYRAIRPLRIYEGTSEIQRTIIGRAIASDPDPNPT